MMKYIILCFAVVFHSSFSLGQTRLIHEKWDQGEIVDDIEISTIQNFNNTKGLKPYRVKIFTDQNMLEVLSLLADVESFPSWIKNIEKNTVLTKTPTRIVVHRTLKRKLPFKKRDLVVEALNFLDFADKKMTVLAKSVELPLVEVPTFHQRAKVLDAFFTIRANSNNETEIQMATLTDLAGWCPAMLSNKLVKEQLLEFARSLKIELETKERKLSPMLESFRSRLYRETK